MIQLPPINKASDSSVTFESKNETKNVERKRSKGSSRCCSCNQSLHTCSCHAPLVPTYQNTYLLASNAPRLIYSNMPIFQVPYFAQSTCNVVGCKDCGFGPQSTDIDDYLRQKISEQLKLYDQSQEQSTKVYHSSHRRRRSCCCCCDCESDEGENIETEQTDEVTKTQVETKQESTEKTEIKHETITDETSVQKERSDIDFKSNQEEDSEKHKPVSEDYESGNYKIAYCCCGKNCHTKAFSSSLTDVREMGPSTKYDINYVKPRRPRMLTRSTSALETSRSRSRSAKSPSSRPPWIPTGQNQYFNTHSARSSIMSGHKYAHDSSTMPIQSLNNSSSQTKTCTEDKSVNTHSNQPSTYYTYQTYEPSKTTIKTTIDSKSYVKPLDYHYYNVVTEKSLPKITQKSVNYECGKGTISEHIRPLSASASYSYTKTQNPTYNYSEIKTLNQSTKNNSYYTVAPSYENTHTHKSSSNYYQPVESTFKGKLYAKNNEIHYVSDNAARSWNSNRNPHVKIVNSTGPVVLHE